MGKRQFTEDQMLAPTSADYINDLDLIQFLLNERTEKLSDFNQLKQRIGLIQMELVKLAKFNSLENVLLATKGLIEAQPNKIQLHVSDLDSAKEKLQKCLYADKSAMRNGELEIIGKVIHAIAEPQSMGYVYHITVSSRIYDENELRRIIA